MNLSTSTNILFNRPNGAIGSITQSIEKCAKAGYKYMDMNFFDVTTFKQDFVRDNYIPYIKNIKEACIKNNVIMNQGHGHFYNFCEKEDDVQNEYVRRSVECSEILGVKWLVFHAATDFDSVNSFKESKKKNIEYISKLADYAARKNVGIAVENLWEYNIAPKRRYTSNAEELVDLVDSINMPNVGICWDFEHADIMRQDQVSALKYIGKRLKAVHVSEQAGVHHDHILPFATEMNWAEFLPTLEEINYEGEFTFEIHRYIKNLPDELLDSALKYSVEVGNYLIKLAKGNKI